MGEAGEDDMFQLLGLPGNGRGDVGMGVAVDVDPPGRDPVDQDAAVGQVEVGALGARDR